MVSYIFLKFWGVGPPLRSCIMKNVRCNPPTYEAFVVGDACGTLSAARAASLRGRLQFMESQVFGRRVPANLHEFQARVVGRSPGINANVSLQEEVNWVLGFLRMDAPRVLKSHVRQSRMLVFTDAALEGSSSLATVGMGAHRMEGERCVDSFHFSDKVPASLKNIWLCCKLGLGE